MTPVSRLDTLGATPGFLKPVLASAGDTKTTGFLARARHVRRRYGAGLLCAGALLVLAGTVQGEDWPEWRGAGRLGVWTETGILEHFPDGGLEVSWRVPIRSGFAGPAVADGRVFVLDYQETPGSKTMDGAERIVALDEQTGEILWTHEWLTTYRMLMATYAVGPRATPTIDGDRVYVVGATGMLLCLETDTGEVVWQINSMEEFGTYVPVWGVSSAMLVDGDKVIGIVGGEPGAKVMAFDKHTGQERWRALSSQWEMGYAQPVIYEAGGVRQLIVWHPQAVTSLNPETGETYWEEPWDAPSSLTIATPVKSGPFLFFTQFWAGSMLMRFNEDRPTASVVWKRGGTSPFPDETDALHSQNTTPIIIGDYVYGVDSYGELRALDLASGTRQWTSDKMTVQARWGAAFMVKNGDRYFVNNDAGDLMIAQFTPEGYVEIDRTHLIEPTTSVGYGARRRFDRLVNWSHPAYANRHIIARNDREIIRASLAQE